jgi:hypothetical protein
MEGSNMTANQIADDYAGLSDEDRFAMDNFTDDEWRDYVSGTEEGKTKALNSAKARTRKLYRSQ